jgi:hypothetical protein
LVSQIFSRKSFNWRKTQWIIKTKKPQSIIRLRYLLFCTVGIQAELVCGWRGKMVSCHSFRHFVRLDMNNFGATCDIWHNGAKQLSCVIASRPVNTATTLCSYFVWNMHRYTSYIIALIYNMHKHRLNKDGKYLLRMLNWKKNFNIESVIFIFRPTRTNLIKSNSFSRYLI